MNRLFILPIILACVSMLPGRLYAQTPEEIEQQMDEIKLDETMLFGEAFDDDKNIAYENALMDLLTWANEERAERGIDMLKMSDLQTVVTELSYTRNGRTSSLVCISVSEMLALVPRSASESIIDTAIGQATPGEASDNNYELTPETEPQPEVVSNSGETENITNTSGLAGMMPPAPDDILATLCAQDNWTEIKGFLSDYKKRGEIIATGYCTSSAEVPSDAYSILIDEMYGVLSILSPKNSTNRINYRTNQPDSESNYPNCKVIVWYK